MKKLFAFLFLFCLLFSKEANAKKYNVVACAIFRDESFFLKEWLDHHLCVGVEHFYLYNNLSEDDYLTILQPYLERGVVTLIDWPYESHTVQEHAHNVQLPAYNHALNIVKKRAKWAAFIDLDEFIVPMKCENLIDLLKDYKDFAGLAINWQIYGTSNCDALPEGKRFTECLVYRAPKKLKSNEHVKCIVQPKYVRCFPSQHFATYEEGYFAVDSKKRPSHGPMQPVVTNSVRINHYWFGTKEWFMTQKRLRREQWGLFIPDEDLERMFEEHNRVYDPCIVRFINIFERKSRTVFSGNHF